MSRPWKVLAAVFSAGAASLMLELSLLREFTYVVGSTAFSNSIVISLYLAGLALGAYAHTLHAAEACDETAALSRFAWIQVFLVGFIFAFAVAKDYFIYSCPERGWILVFFAGGTFLPSFFAGAAYSAALRALHPCGQKYASYVYACSTWGSVVGGLAHGFVFMNFFGAQSAYASAIACCAIAFFLARPPARKIVFRSAVFLVIGLCLAVQTEAANRAIYPFYDRLLFRRSSPAGVVEVWRLPESKAFEMSVNNAHQYYSHSWDTRVHVEWAAATLDMIEGPATALLLGYGSGVSSSAFLKSPKTARVDTVEFSPAVVEAGKRFYPAEHRLVVSDPRSKLILRDFRSHIRFTGERYDIIALDHRMADPYAAGFYTKEFFEQLKKILKPGGVIASLGVGLTWSTTTSVFPYAYKSIDPEFSEPFRESVLFFSAAPLPEGLRSRFLRVGVSEAPVVYRDGRIEGMTWKIALKRIFAYAGKLAQR